MDRENAGSRTGVSNPNWPCLCSKNFTFACFMIPENSNKLHFKRIPEITCCSLVHGIDFVTWQTYVNLCCNYWIRRDNSLHQQKEFWLCNIWCLFCYDFNASCVFVFVVRFFGLSLLQIYHICKFIIYANLSYMHADFANQNFRLPLYERRKFLIIIFQWCSINGNANLSRREEKRLTVFTH